jgi:hypothetical protein
MRDGFGENKAMVRKLMDQDLLQSIEIRRKIEKGETVVVGLDMPEDQLAKINEGQQEAGSPKLKRHQKSNGDEAPDLGLDGDVDQIFEDN